MSEIMDEQYAGLTQARLPWYYRPALFKMSVVLMAFSWVVGLFPQSRIQTPARPHQDGFDVQRSVTDYVAGTLAGCIVSIPAWLVLKGGLRSYLLGRRGRWRMQLAFAMLVFPSLGVHLFTMPKVRFDLSGGYLVGGGTVLFARMLFRLMGMPGSPPETKAA